MRCVAKIPVMEQTVAAAVKRRECGKLVALNLDLLHGERSPPVERASR